MVTINSIKGVDILGQETHDVIAKCFTGLAFPVVAKIIGQDNSGKFYLLELPNSEKVSAKWLNIQWLNIAKYTD